VFIARDPGQWRILLDYLSLDEKLVDRQLKKWYAWRHELALHLRRVQMRGMSLGFFECPIWLRLVTAVSNLVEKKILLAACGVGQSSCKLHEGLLCGAGDKKTGGLVARRRSQIEAVRVSGSMYK
jgi:hypothetical protein